MPEPEPIPNIPNILKLKAHFEIVKNSLPVDISYEIIVKLLIEAELLIEHIENANRQRASYIKSKQNLDEDTLFIEIDWKENFKIGMSPRQVSSEFYSQKPRTCIGFGVYEKKNRQLKCTNFDIISDYNKKTASAVNSSFRF